MSTLIAGHGGPAAGTKSGPAPFWNPYAAGFGLGLVLLAAYLIAGRGLGATGAFSSFAAWIGKRVLLRGFHVAAERRGYFPARFFRVGSDDEALGYVRDIERIVRDGWRSADGADDYDAALGAIRTPVFAIASGGDRIQASPAAVRSFHAPCANLTVDVVDRANDGGPAPNHAELVTTMKARTSFDRVLAFLRDRA